MTLFATTFATPAGPLAVAINADLAVVGTAFGDLAHLRARLKKCHVLRDTSPEALVELGPADAKFERVLAAILARFPGGAPAAAVTLHPTGSPFQKRVWAALQQIPAGETRSYGDIARALKTSPRAVGRANATNPICFFIPCHRVIGGDGSLTGFAFGETIKRRLLELEGVRLSAPVSR